MPCFDFNDPLIEDALSVYRRVDTSTYQRFMAIRKASTILAYNIVKLMPYNSKTVSTLTNTVNSRILDRNIIFVPKIRSGLAMIDSFIEVFNVSNTGYILMDRKYTGRCDKNDSVLYSTISNNCLNSQMMILDPLIATGGTIDLIIDYLISCGVSEKQIAISSLICNPEGAKHIQEKHSNVCLYAGIITEVLDSNAGVTPRIGDFGDRVFGKWN